MKYSDPENRNIATTAMRAPGPKADDMFVFVADSNAKNVKKRNVPIPSGVIKGSLPTLKRAIGEAL